MPSGITGSFEEKKTHKTGCNSGCHDLKHGKIGEEKLAHDHLIARDSSLLQEESEYDPEKEPEDDLGFPVFM
jgi:hypothetical protein